MAAPQLIDEFTSQKFRFYAFISMVLLVFVHGYNLDDRYLLPFSIVIEQLTLNTFTQYFLANGIFRFRIPMLFIISGYLFALRDDKPYGERIKKRVRTLFVPYLLWSAIGLLVTYLFELWPLTREAVAQASLQPFAGTRVVDYSPVQLLARWIMAPVPFQLWFIRVLLVYNLAYPWLASAVTRYPKIFFPFAGFFWLTTAGTWFAEGEGLLFFSLGIWLCKRQYDIQTPPSWLRIGPVSAVWVTFAGVKTWLAFRLSSVIPSCFRHFYSCTNLWSRVDWLLCGSGQTVLSVSLWVGVGLCVSQRSRLLSTRSMSRW